MAWITNMTVLTITIIIVECQEPSYREERHLQKVVRQSSASDFNSEIVTSRTRAYLACESGEMLLKINFTEPYHGMTYANDRFSPCRFYGDGRKHYEMRIPLKGCGTKQQRPRIFINNVLVRFHPSLELEGDEIKTIICRYPPPLAPPPSNVIAPLIPPSPPSAPSSAPRLSEIDILIIVCSILFLTLLILGIGIAYFCLKRRNIHLVKKKSVPSSSPSSQITKLSGTSISAFDPIRIPRATALSTTGSEAALLTSTGDRSDTIPSDYPSDSLSSDVDDLDGRGSAANTIDSVEPVYARIQKGVGPPHVSTVSIVPRKVTVRNIDDRFVTETTEVTSTERFTKKIRQLPGLQKDHRTWDVVFRILNPPQSVQGADSLTQSDKDLWESTVIGDSKFRSLVEEATTSRDVSILTDNHQYGRLYDPQKWSVIIRILNSPHSLHSERRTFGSRPTTLSPVPSSRAESDVDSVSSIAMSRTGRERSTSEYLEDAAVINEQNFIRPSLELSMSDYFIHQERFRDRATEGSTGPSVTRVPSIGEREAVKSVTEEQVSDWQK